MDTVFITHNELGLACLEELAELDANIEAIYTRPEDSGLADQTSFASLAETTESDLREVDSVNNPAIRREIADRSPDLMFVIGWSQLVKPIVLNIPSVGAFGMHPAPLPRGRGRAPIPWSLIKGLDETALSFFHLVEDADSGDIVGQKPLPIEIDDNAASLYRKIIEAGRGLIREYYPRFEEGDVPRIPQPESDATWWPKRSPHHGLIDWHREPMDVYNWIRGLSNPYPGAFSFLDDKKVKIWGAKPPQDSREFISPGEIVDSQSDVLTVGTWEGTIDLTRIQVSEDEEMAAARLLEEYDVNQGDRFVNARDLLVSKTNLKNSKQ